MRASPNRGANEPQLLDGFVAAVRASAPLRRSGVAVADFGDPGRETQAQAGDVAGSRGDLYPPPRTSCLQRPSCTPNLHRRRTWTWRSGEQEEGGRKEVEDRKWGIGDSTSPSYPSSRATLRTIFT